MQVVVVDKANAPRWSAHTDAMHVARHRVFVEAMGWEALRRADGREADQFDGANAVYLLALDADGVLRGSLRLLPTTAPTMLSTVFQAYLDAPLAADPAIWEWSRHAPGDPDTPHDVNAAARAALHVGVCEFAARAGVRAFVALMETRLLRAARAFGWPCSPLGPPRSYAEGEAQAVWNPVDADRLHALRIKTGLFTPVLRSDA